jgi:NADPH-dependent 7-cyano-7-deazaguanine reductase QueF-like protein
MSTKEYITKDAHVNVKLVYLSDKSLPLVPHGKVLCELNSPVDIESRELKFYTDSSAFEAKVPYDYSYILAKATNLTKVPDLESKVVCRFNEIRQYYVNLDAVGYIKDMHLTFPTGDVLFD